MRATPAAPAQQPERHPQDQTSERRPAKFLIALGTAGVHYGVIRSGRPAPILRGLSLLVLARLSYSLYLVHLPLIPSLIWLVDGPIRLTDAPQALRFAASLHYLVEKPFLLLRNPI
jgi:peptidoglycan/LPS O-acetylase OafA/YrhL